MNVDVPTWCSLRLRFFIKNVFVFIVLITTIILHNFAFFGFLHGIVAILSCFCGLCCWQFFICKWFLLPLHRLNNGRAVSINHLKMIGEEKSEILVPYSVDEALDQIFCRIVDQYISSWYCHISSDAWFQSEARLAIRNLTISMYERTNRVNINRLLLRKVIPVCLNHIVETKSEVAHLHLAVHSRKSEACYVQNLSKCLLKYLLPPSDFYCKSYAIFLREIISRCMLLSLSDAVCNPALLNHLILRYFNDNFSISKRFEREGKADNDHVELLQNFVTSYKTHSFYSSLRPDVHDILKEKELLDTFMHYLRSRKTEHVLQFCLDVATFNEKILKPELEAEELDDLYRDAWDLFSVYFSCHSPNFITFHKDLASPLRKALSKDILKLRTTSTLFEAYEYAFTVLERFCLDFYNSREFYYWLYGRYDTHEMAMLDPSYSQSHSSAGIKESFSRKKMFEFGNKFSKIKDALKPDNILDGRLCDSRKSTVNEESQFYSTEVGIDVQLTEDNEKSMDKWIISIPTVFLRLDPITNKTCTFLVIHVMNGSNIKWFVERRSSDLHLLTSKLIEFHEYFTDTHLQLLNLPTVYSDNAQVCTLVNEYEDHINTLISHPELKNSELLRIFLTSSEFNECDEDYEEGEESGFGKIFRKSVVSTLRKERGHNLDAFVKSLTVSCWSTNLEWKDAAEQKKHRKISDTNVNLMYGNNFDLNADTTEQVILRNTNGRLYQESYRSPFSLLILIAFKVYRLRSEIIQALLIVKAVFGKLIDQFLYSMTNKFLKTTSTNCNISYLINTIEWAIFDNKIKYNDDEIRRRMHEVLSGMKNDWLHRIYVLVFESLQDAKKNKQLFYNLTDIVVEELFPEMYALSEE